MRIQGGSSNSVVQIIILAKRSAPSAGLQYVTPSFLAPDDGELSFAHSELSFAHSELSFAHSELSFAHSELSFAHSELSFAHSSH